MSDKGRLLGYVTLVPHLGGMSAAYQSLGGGGMGSGRTALRKETSQLVLENVPWQGVITLPASQGDSNELNGHWINGEGRGVSLVLTPTH